MPAAAWGWLITPEEFAAWILWDSPEVAVLNKPALVLCHPSKHGPWSSLIGAAREYFCRPVLHMPFRLDRETSGVWVVAKTREYGRALQRAVQDRRVRKTYLAILEGELRAPVTVDQPVGPSRGARIRLRQAVVAGGSPAAQVASTHFDPLEMKGGRTLVRVTPATGRRHQIRVHAQWLGHPLVGDKIYGPDETLFEEFIARGYSGRVAELLPLPRQALHCESVWVGLDPEPVVWRAPLAPDLAAFWDGCSRSGP